MALCQSSRATVDPTELDAWPLCLSFGTPAFLSECFLDPEGTWGISFAVILCALPAGRSCSCLGRWLDAQGVGRKTRASTEPETVPGPTRVFLTRRSGSCVSPQCGLSCAALPLHGGKAVPVGLCSPKDSPPRCRALNVLALPKPCVVA